MTSQKRDPKAALKAAIAFLSEASSLYEDSDGREQPENPAGRLDMGCWSSHRNGCGTRACLGGLLTTSEDMRALGLLKRSDVIPGEGEDWMPLLICEPGDEYDLVIKEEAYLTEFDALKALFDLDEAQASFIFSGHNFNSFALGLERMRKVYFMKYEEEA